MHEFGPNPRKLINRVSCGVILSEQVDSEFAVSPCDHPIYYIFVTEPVICLYMFIFISCASEIHVTMLSIEKDFKSQPFVSVSHRLHKYSTVI